MYAQEAEVTGMAPQTLTNVKYVSRQIENSRRRENLPFALHAEVAALPPREQDRCTHRTSLLPKCDAPGVFSCCFHTL